MVFFYMTGGLVQFYILCLCVQQLLEAVSFIGLYRRDRNIAMKIIAILCKLKRETR